MNPDALNIGGGQFGQAIGGVDALRQAFSRRNVDASVLDQVSASSPTGPAQTLPAPENNVMNQAPQAPQQEQAPFRSGEMEIALKALKSTVDTENTLAKQALKLAAPPQNI